MEIILHKEYLNHDIRQLTHRYADQRSPDDEKRLSAQLGQDASDEQLLQRLCQQGITQLHHLLFKDLNPQQGISDAKLREQTEWTLTFKREFYNQQTLAQHIHWFIVKWAVWQWTQMFMPAESGAAKTDLDEVAQLLRSVVFHRLKPELLNW